MPLTGNRLGPKTRVEYASDSGLTYNLRVDADLLIPAGGLVAGATGVAKPIGCEPRGVHAQFLDTVAAKTYRKFFICGEAASTLFASNTPQGVVCDTLTFTTTGRKGEVQRFL